MDLKRYFKNSIPFFPHRRNYAEALKWLNLWRPKILSNSLKPQELKTQFGLEPIDIERLSPEFIQHALDILTYSEFDQTYNQEAIYDFFLQGDFAPGDNIQLPVIRKLIKEGLGLMQTSQDPAHGFTHAIRCGRLAKILYQALRPAHPRLDWGVLATAAIWHDIYRINHLGFLYSKNSLWRKALRKIDILQDLIIYSIHRQDSIGSSLFFLKQSRKRLPKQLRAQIAIAILGEHTFEFLEEKFYPGISVYKNIILNADVIDMVSTGRWEETHRNVILRHQTDRAFLKRMITLNALFNISRAKNKVTFPLAHQLYQLAQKTLYQHGMRYYPDDAKMMKELLMDKPS
ncbi:MAG: hypothetical protein A2445_01580 [Candidatus Jacksonbacteria bacterium RIFOXYC2_FULL_44_29]|nr:MAG: hypothetical protein UW45_C0024G0010 [Parcubacteria group bacterium GW2011_GWC2_44_22]OGY75067.1 MAG: hypothetical protein A2240_00670 [Candidatus Jacksonbacteria bacterium RIFOXYA2_FULL_43_12]OGY77542.1 MAG: hypothetical protein A2295_05350 [Candidatus Jacksonbacteria bacterium RIFOXYB2_FULL_44_15]OGY79968.1 MAG: hypothetical protein A2550_05515 [Candidatus Jacksonbacteria bacterium RIFOXYD2_FULL_43_21]OGY80344.1 MAG: hypothetical protein A2445_01580 [Candidatus Jacksonbacteria bacteri